MSKKLAALLYNHHYHLLDHLAPICELLNMPLIVTDKKNLTLSSKFYPNMKVHHLSSEKLTLPFLAKNFDVLFKSTKFMPDQKGLFKLLCHKDMKLVFCPHGNSDKGYKKPLLKPYIYHDLVLLYGEHMINLLKKQNLFSQLKKYVTVGNIRLAYYQKHKKYLDKILEAEIFSKLNPINKNILYAPTWDDHEGLSSFFELTRYLINNLPPHLNLLIKPHPLLKDKNPSKYYSLLQPKKNTMVIQDLPLIYPLLSKCDAYIGDFSSIGYDYLYFQRPMLFFDKQDRINDPAHYLFSCGHRLEKSQLENIFPIIDQMLEKNSFKPVQKTTYHYAFGKEKSFIKIKKEILDSLNPKKSIHG